LVSPSADWQWALLQADTRAHAVPPLQITRSTDPNAADDLGLMADPGEVIRGLPYTVRFETYIDRQEHPSPIERALRGLRSDPSMRLEWKICYEIVHGQHQPDTLRAILGSPNGFDEAARRGLAFIRSRAEEYLRYELTTISERRRNSGEMYEAREADKHEIEAKLGRRRAGV